MVEIIICDTPSHLIQTFGIVNYVYIQNYQIHYPKIMEATFSACEHIYKLDKHMYMSDSKYR